MPTPADRQTLAPGRRFRVTEVVVYEFPAIDEDAALQQLIDRYVEPVDTVEFPGLEL